MSDQPVENRWNRVLRPIALVVGALGALGLCAMLVLLLTSGGGTGDDGFESTQDAGLQSQIEAARATGLFILVDTARNRLFLRKGEEVLLEAVCSTGSGVELVAKDKKWTFRTPRGSFRVISKSKNPVWRKPDWAFLEEGEPIPKRESDRYEAGVLGDYALGIGDGYFIHGTLYTRLLGTNVTHGCIRLGGDDLEFLTKKVPVGTRVFIY